MSGQGLTKESLYCPSCGGETVADNACSACEWRGCMDDVHNYKYLADMSVGIGPHLQCRGCGLEIPYDGRYDQDDDL